MVGRYERGGGSSGLKKVGRVSSPFETFVHKTKPTFSINRRDNLNRAFEPPRLPESKPGHKMPGPAEHHAPCGQRVRNRKKQRERERRERRRRRRKKNSGLFLPTTPPHNNNNNNASSAHNTTRRHRPSTPSSPSRSCAPPPCRSRRSGRGPPLAGCELRRRLRREEGRARGGPRRRPPRASLGPRRPSRPRRTLPRAPRRGGWPRRGGASGSSGARCTPRGLSLAGSWPSPRLPRSPAPPRCSLAGAGAEEEEAEAEEEATAEEGAEQRGGTGEPRSRSGPRPSRWALPSCCHSRSSSAPRAGPCGSWRAAQPPGRRRARRRGGRREGAPLAPSGAGRPRDGVSSPRRSRRAPGCGRGRGCWRGGLEEEEERGAGEGAESEGRGRATSESPLPQRRPK